ncbi:MAG: hypothetical protein OD816_001057 [Thermodesulfobacterium sp.]|uniref:ATPase domain-containing protein n=1 Tax=Candidatus Thermodesulfobacterium syntrophicum TaxID=3060442 RepID=A0AAE3P0P7_9BACT|nr:hypothetical protein [Candidatus Thermodesulfobacterium syntrophicum]
MKEIEERKEEKEIIVSREEVKRRLKELLSRKEPICIVIKGEWGVGKTHLLKEFLNNELKEEKYAYISLFGKYSLEDIKSDLTLQLSKAIKYTNVLGQVLENIKSVSPHLGSIGSLLSLLTSKEFKDVIVCFDEFERLSPNLEIKEVFGFISHLKENLNCKIVLIMDEDKIISDKIQEYNQYKEKIVDYEIKLNPSVEENLGIVVNNQFNISESFKQVITEFATLLNVKNIRILRKLVNTFKDFSFIENINELQNDRGYIVKLEFYRKLVLLSYIAYKYNKTESLKEVLEKIISALNHKIFKTSKSDEMKLERDEEEIKKVIKTYPILSWGGIFSIESRDIDYICKYIKYSLTTEDLIKELRSFLIERCTIIKNVEIVNKFDKLIKELQFNLSKSSKEIGEEILKFISDNSNLNAIISSKGIISFVHSLLFIEKLTKEKKFSKIAKNCFKNFVDSKKEELFFSYPKLTTFKMNLGHIFDENFKRYAIEILNKKIEEVRKENVSDISCEKVINIIKDIFQKSGWNKKDEAILNSLSKGLVKSCFENFVEFTEICIEFYRWRKKVKGSNAFEKFLNTLKEAIEELEIEKPRKDYIKNLLNSE